MAAGSFCKRSRCGRRDLRRESIWGCEVRKKKVAITGIHNSGKTMFLTSLLWQLEAFDKKRFPLGEIEISAFREISSSVGGVDMYTFRSYRSKMRSEGRWPRKTKDIHRFRCQFKRSDKGWKFLGSEIISPLQQLDILDFPGERISDAAIAAYGNFDQWSDYMFTHFADNHGYNEAGERLWKSLDAKNLTIETAVEAYRKTLISFIRDYRPLISPSVFFLDGGGDLLDLEKIESVSERLCGLDTDSQFVPLPEPVREKNPELTEKMREHFKKYHRRMGKPLFDDLAKSDSLIVLVDIPSLLVGGVERYNDNSQIIRDLFDVIGRKKFKFWPSSLKRIAFVATKIDLVLSNDSKEKRLIPLLEEMNSQAVGLLPDGIKVEWFECSACWSTADGESENTLSGVLWDDKKNPGKEFQQFDVSPLPATWPGHWSYGEYLFPEVYPEIPSNRQKPPEHQGLSEVFDFAVIR